MNFRKNFLHYVVLWFLFFCIGFSLGYPTLNRYEPQNTRGLKDATYYRHMVEEGVESLKDGHWRYRILIPYIAKPIYKLSIGRVGTWSPAYFALLVVNAAVIAFTALLILKISFHVTGLHEVGPIAALLFMCHFNVSNMYLSGLIDGGELFFMTLLAWLLIREKWAWLPFISIFGSLAKESFVPFSIAFSAGWFAANVYQKESTRYFPVLMIGALAATGILTVCGLQTVILGELISPWHIVSGELGRTIPRVPDLISENIFNRGFLYTFAWLLPLGALGIRHISLPFMAGSLSAIFSSLTLCLIAGCGENIGRPLFNAGGPLLIIAAANFIVKLTHNKSAANHTS